MRYALIEKASGLVSNIIEWNGDVETWLPAETQLAEPTDSANIGDTFKNSEFHPAEPSQQAAPKVHSVTMRQARLALLASGQLQNVAEAIAALPSPQRDAALIEWEFAATVERNSPLVDLLGGALELDGDALDQLFTDASAL